MSDWRLIEVERRSAERTLRRAELAAADGAEGMLRLTMTVETTGQATGRRPRLVVVHNGTPVEGRDLGEGAYAHEVPRQPGSYRVTIEAGPGDSRSWLVMDRRQGPFALTGSGDHLFLGGDSNDSIGQWLGENRLSADNIKGWDLTFAQFPLWKRDFGIDTAFLVAPSKEEIFPDIYPIPRGRPAMVDDFIAAFKDKGLVFPKWELRARRNLTWTQTETHWTDYGATVAAMALLKAWKLDDHLGALPQDFRVVHRIGDLGSKIAPHRTSYEMVFPPHIAPRKVFDNGVENTGCLRVWHNPDAPLAEGAMIFGDSFGFNLAPALSGVFREVVYVYRAGAMDARLVKMMAPRYVALEITQRFLHGLPDQRRSIFRMAARKIAEMAPGKRAETVAGLQAAPAPFAEIARRTLARLEELSAPPAP